MLLVRDPPEDRPFLGRDVGLADLAALYAAPADAPTWLRVNMVSTLDGAAHGPDGRSGSINTPADHVVFEVLRAIADAVVVGAGTVRAEGYRPLRLSGGYAALRAELGLPAALPLVVVSRTGELPAWDLRQSDSSPVHAVVPACSTSLGALRDALGVQAVHMAGDTDVDLAAGLGALHRCGWRRLLSEGGPTLLASLLGAGLVDELDLTFAPMLVGGPYPRIVGIEPRIPPTEFQPVLLLEENGSMIGRWLRHR